MILLHQLWYRVFLDGGWGFHLELGGQVLGDTPG